MQTNFRNNYTGGHFQKLGNKEHVCSLIAKYTIKLTQLVPASRCITLKTLVEQRQDLTIPDERYFLT